MHGRLATVGKACRKIFDKLSSGAMRVHRCPVCSSGEVEYLGSHCVEAISRTWMQRFGIDLRHEFEGLAQFHAARCTECRLEFYPGAPAGSGAMYGLLQAFPWYYLKNKWEHAQALAELDRGKRILEIGSGEGEFLARAVERGLTAQGLELNEHAARIAMNSGMQVERRLMSELLPSQAGSFDAVCSFQVLEHVPQPLEFLSQACALVKPGGLLITAVPDGSGWIRFEDNPLDLPPHHVSRWTEETFRRLTSLLPLRVKRIAREPLPKHHIRGFVAAYAREAKRRTHGLVRLGSISQALARAYLATGAHARFAGQGLYVSLERTSQPAS